MMYMPSIFGENLFDEFFSELDRSRTGKASYGRLKNLMKTDIRENEQGYELSVELPGYKKEELKLELKDGYLRISGEKQKNEEKKDEQGRLIRQERYSGSVQRSFFVGENLTEEDIRAKFEDGILKLSVPKKEVKKLPEHRYIEIS